MIFWAIEDKKGRLKHYRDVYTQKTTTPVLCATKQLAIEKIERVDGWRGCKPVKVKVERVEVEK